MADLPLPGNNLPLGKGSSKLKPIFQKYNANGEIQVDKPLSESIYGQSL
jgi:hypothetical protein